ncbi:MAG: YraN family protein [bacterium]|nr:YraN family protein [bacterium]
MNKRAIGSAGEAQAAAYLEQLGYQIEARNVYAGHKEIDLVAREGKYLVFVEVKYAKNRAMGDPLEKVDTKKQNHIRHAAREYLYRNHLSEDTACRFDVVRILGKDISLIRDAF